jgi:hypothetical protein
LRLLKEGGGCRNCLLSGVGGRWEVGMFSQVLLEIAFYALTPVDLARQRETTLRIRCLLGLNTDSSHSSWHGVVQVYEYKLEFYFHFKFVYNQADCRSGAISLSQSDHVWAQVLAG